MGIFSRKKKAEIPEYEPVFPEPKHEHIWKDMPWYMDVSYNGVKSTAQYKIIEPYICVTCGERKNVTLESCSWENISIKDRDEEYEKVLKKYKKYIKPRAVVEDMINNILLVKDPDHLRMVEKLLGSPHRDVGTSAEMNMTEESKFRIDIPKRHGDEENE